MWDDEIRLDAGRGLASQDSEVHRVKRHELQVTSYLDGRNTSLASGSLLEVCGL